MTGERRLDRYLRSLHVANFADHDDVGIVAQQRAEHIGEAQADALLHLNLVDAVELVLDRILDGEDLALGRVEADERCVERRGLAAARWPGDKKDAVRALERVEIDLEVAAAQAKRREIQPYALAVQQPQHDALA